MYLFRREEGQPQNHARSHEGANAMAKQVEAIRQRRYDRGLTLPQANAVELLAAGKNDTQTAEALGLAREAVGR